MTETEALPPRRKLHIFQLLPNLISILALCSGLTAIRFAVEGKFGLAVALIGLAAALDGIDGRLARMLKSSAPEDRAVTEKVRVVFPNQGTTGTHLNIAGAAVAKHAKNKDNAIAFMEFLASPFAQDYFANGNNEFPAVKGLKVDNPAIKAMGGDNFKAEQIPLGVVAKNLTKVQQMLDRVGFQ